MPHKSKADTTVEQVSHALVFNEGDEVKCPACGKPISLETATVSHHRKLVGMHDCLGLPLRATFETDLP